MNSDDIQYLSLFNYRRKRPFGKASNIDLICENASVHAGLADSLSEANGYKRARAKRLTPRPDAPIGSLAQSAASGRAFGFSLGLRPAQAEHSPAGPYCKEAGRVAQGAEPE
jgi:hypothetical protein